MTAAVTQINLKHSKERMYLIFGGDGRVFLHGFFFFFCGGYSLQLITVIALEQGCQTDSEDSDQLIGCCLVGMKTCSQTACCGIGLTSLPCLYNVFALKDITYYLLHFYLYKMILLAAGGIYLSPPYYTALLHNTNLVLRFPSVQFCP